MADVRTGVPVGAGSGTADQVGSAVARTEWILAVTIAVFRLCTLALVAAGVLASARMAPMAAIGAGLGAETALFAAMCFHDRRVSRRWIAADLLTVAVALLLSVLPAGSGPPGESPFYGVALMIAAVVGVADWPLWTALGLAVVPAAVNIGSAVLPAASSYPVWNAIPDGTAILGSVLIVWVLCQVARRVGADHDRHRAAAVEQAALLGRERERLRYAQALRERLLDMLERLAEPSAVPDPVLAEQLRRETVWLRELVAGSPGEPIPGLEDGLAAVAARIKQFGVAVTVDLPPVETELAEPVREALLDAVGEALTNVGKHARTSAASVAVQVDANQVVVTVTDRGLGYVPNQVSAGLGQALSVRRRVAELGGSAEITSAPGVGTTVVLRVPTVRAEWP